jgi:RNA polymerase sigma-70 factor (ECF subfamily)
VEATVLDPHTNQTADPLSASAGNAVDAELTAIYEQYLPSMVRMAVHRFRISTEDAETIAHEVYLDFILKRQRVTAVRPWLFACMFRASVWYSRRRARSETLPADYAEMPDPEFARIREILPDRLAAEEALGCATERCQLALRLRYVEGYTIAEIARELKTTERYAENLVGRCLKQARKRYSELRARGGAATQ